MFHEWRCACGSAIENDGIIFCRAQAAKASFYDTLSLGTINSVWDWIDKEQIDFRTQLQRYREAQEQQEKMLRESARREQQARAQIEHEHLLKQEQQIEIQKRAKYTKGQRRQQQQREQVRQIRRQQERQLQRRHQKRLRRSADKNKQELVGNVH